MLYAFHSKKKNKILTPVLFQQDHRITSIVANLVKIDDFLFYQLALKFPLRGSSLVVNGLRLINFVWNLLDCSTTFDICCWKKEKKLGFKNKLRHQPVVNTLLVTAKLEFRMYNVSGMQYIEYKSILKCEYFLSKKAPVLKQLSVLFI